MMALPPPRWAPDSAPTWWRPRLDGRAAISDPHVLDEAWRDDYRLGALAGSATGVIVDVGANIGAVTVLALVGRCCARVVAVEPHPGNVAELQEHLRLNRVAHLTTVIEAAAVDEVRGREIYVEQEAHGGTRTGAARNGPAVAQATLDDVLLGAVLHGPIRLLKLDTEGWEHTLLRSETAAHWAEQREVERIAFEFHADDAGELGLTVEHLADWYHVEVRGRPSIGGMVYATRH